VLLTGRATFCAGGNFASEVEALTRARVAGEPAGGSPHNYGDSALVELAADHFAGRDLCSQARSRCAR
jgi:hypothetical protein